MSIDFGGFAAGMAQKLLDYTQLGSGFEQTANKGTISAPREIVIPRLTNVCLLNRR
jgi:hypothetical protein